MSRSDGLVFINYGRQAVTWSLAFPCSNVRAAQVFLPVAEGRQDTEKDAYVVEVRSYQTEPAAALFFSNTRPTPVTIRLSLSPALPWLQIKSLPWLTFKAGYGATGDASGFTLPPNTMSAISIGVVPDTGINFGDYNTTFLLTFPDFPTFTGPVASAVVSVKNPFANISMVNFTSMPPVSSGFQISNPSPSKPVTATLLVPNGGNWLSVSPGVLNLPANTEAAPGFATGIAVFSPTVPGLYASRLFAQTTDSFYPIVPAGGAAVAFHCE
eukprot:tig00021178_g19197.t1